MTEQIPTTPVEAADMADTYDRMLRLADLFDASGQEMRLRSKLGPRSSATRPCRVQRALQADLRRRPDDIRSATTGTRGLLTRSIELDADAW
jgi:hypothetical protein